MQQRRLEWFKEDDGLDDGDVELSMDDEPDENKDEQEQSGRKKQKAAVAVAAKRSSPSPPLSSLQGKTSQPARRDAANMGNKKQSARVEIVLDDDDD